MPSKQQEFYTQTRQQAETLVQTYQEFAKQIASIKATAKERIKSLKCDMKEIAHQVSINNKLLKARGQEVVEFKKIPTTK